MKPHICAQCGRHFQSGHPTARYCTLRCQRNAATLRRKGRDSTALAEVDERFYTVVHDPLVHQLDGFAKDILLDLTDDKPIKVIGNVPRWNPPKGIDFVEQFGEDITTFIMIKHVKSIMEVLAEQPSPGPK